MSGITMRRGPAVAVMVAVLASACRSGSDGGGGGEGWTAAVDTIDGVVRVVNTPPEEGAGPTLVAEEEFRIGAVEGGGPTSFGLIRSIAVLPDGRFAVADAQAEEVRLFSAGGAHLRTFGGAGQGPGELQGMQGVHVHNGMLRVAEQANARLSVFHPDSGFVRTYPLRLFSYGFRGPWAAAIDSAGRTFVASSGQYGEGRFWNMVRVYDTAMNQLDSLPYHDYTDESQQEEVPGAWRIALGTNAWTWAQVPFYARPHQVLTPTGEFLTTTGGSPRLEVSRWSPAGDTSLVFTSLRVPDRVTTAERDSAMNALEEGFAERTGTRPGLDPSRVPAEKPTVYGLFLDDRGRLWVRITEPSADSTAYDVFGPDGSHAETVRMPFRVDGWVPPVVRGDTLWAVVTDEMDVQNVARADLHPVDRSVPERPGVDEGLPPTLGERVTDSRLEVVHNAGSDWEIGDRVSLSDLEGKPVILDFWASWCGPCRRNHEYVAGLKEEYGDRIIVVGVLFEDTPEAARAFIEEHGRTYPTVQEVDGALVKQFRITGVPHFVMLTPDRRLSWDMIATLTRDSVAPRLQAMVRN